MGSCRPGRPSRTTLPSARSSRRWRVRRSTSTRPATGSMRAGRRATPGATRCRVSGHTRPACLKPSRKRSRSSEGFAISAELLADSRGEIKAADGTELHWQAWSPRDPKLALAVIHGHGEHGGRYAGLAAAMARHGIATFAADVRGHGTSGGARGHVMSWDILLRDAAD